MTMAAGRGSRPRWFVVASWAAAWLVIGAAGVGAQEQAPGPVHAAAPAVTAAHGNGAPGAEKDAAGKAAEEETPDGKKDEAEAKEVGFVGLPIPIANPTLQQGLALVGAALYHIGKDSPASFTGVGGMYTSTKSWGYGLVQKIYTSHDRWRITAGAVRFKLNLRFYGIDDTSRPGDSYIGFTLDGKAVSAEVLHSMGKDTYLGLGYVHLSSTTSFHVSHLPPDEDLPGLALRQSVAFLTVPFQWDTRDNPMNPGRGNSLKLTATFSGSAVGSDFTYQQYRFGFSHYAHLNDRMVLALKGSACDTRNRAPFYMLCTLGSGDGLRGFPVERYWSRSSAAAVAEWRFRFAGRWGMVAFAGAGATGRGITNLDTGNPVPSYGVGIRFLMAKDYGVNIGLDYGRSSGRDAIYFRVGEAF